jgi:hypothetical protein
MLPARKGFHSSPREPSGGSFFNSRMKWPDGGSLEADQEVNMVSHAADSCEIPESSTVPPILMEAVSPRWFNQGSPVSMLIRDGKEAEVRRRHEVTFWHSRGQIPILRLVVGVAPPPAAGKPRRQISSCVSQGQPNSDSGVILTNGSVSSVA